MRAWLLGLMALCCWGGLAAHAQDQTLAACANRLEAQGFEVIDRDFDDGLYEFEALKAGQKWEIKMDRSCQLIRKRIDD